jgi:hypothetical protein
MITNENIKETILEAQKKGYNISVRDIAYATLCLSIDDTAVIYKCLFGKDENFQQEQYVAYDNTAAVNYLKTYVEYTLLDKKKKASSTDISFEENKAEIINLINETKRKEEAGEIDAKQSLDLQTKLRVTLNDKFKVQSESQDQVIVVNAKYDSICPSCFREVSRRPMTKQEAMEEYDLVERT